MDNTCSSTSIDDNQAEGDKNMEENLTSKEDSNKTSPENNESNKIQLDECTSTSNEQNDTTTSTEVPVTNSNEISDSSLIASTIEPESNQNVDCTETKEEEVKEESVEEPVGESSKEETQSPKEAETVKESVEEAASEEPETVEKAETIEETSKEPTAETESSSKEAEATKEPAVEIESLTKNEEDIPDPSKDKTEEKVSEILEEVKDKSPEVPIEAPQKEPEEKPAETPEEVAEKPAEAENSPEKPADSLVDKPQLISEPEAGPSEISSEKDVEKSKEKLNETETVGSDKPSEEEDKESSGLLPIENAFVECENFDDSVYGDKTSEMSSSMLDDQSSKDAEDNQTVFVQVNSEEAEKEADKDDVMERDPIGSDVYESLGEDREGADEELCIIPDTERVLSQAEKDAASVIPPLRDITAASSESLEETAVQSSSSEALTEIPPITVHKYEKDDLQVCSMPRCMLTRKVKYSFQTGDEALGFLCDDNCLEDFKGENDKVVMAWEEGNLRVKNFTTTTSTTTAGKELVNYDRICASCQSIVDDADTNLTWEIMDFCNEQCLTKYQKQVGAHCSSCKRDVKTNSLGKYCVRFGNDIRQFCTSHCLEEYKKGLKVCSYCQQDMSGGPEGFLAPVGDKGQFKDFCSQLCMEKYDVMTNDRPPKVAPGTKCSVCKADKPISIEFELDEKSNYFCGEPCFVAFSFVNNISPGNCALCKRSFSKSILEKNTMFYDNVQHSFCSNSCKNIYIIAHRKIVPCSWCKVKKYNFDMIRRFAKDEPEFNMCSVNCLNLYQLSVNAVASKKQTCNYCQKNLAPMYHLTMSDATIRNFCSYTCVMTFQNKFSKPITLNNVDDPVPTGAPKKTRKINRLDENGPAASTTDSSTLPVITNVQSLANTNGGVPPLLPTNQSSMTTRSTRSKASASQVPPLNSLPDIPVQIQVKQHFIVRPAPVTQQRNVSTMCSIRKTHKSTMSKPIMVNKECSTDKREADRILIPVPVPIYVPTPLHMYAVPVPIPVPFPIPIPVPIFIPTTRNSATGIMKEIKKIQVKIPTDPYEAELLMMAEMVAEEKKEEHTDSESDVDDAGGADDNFSPEPVDASNTFGDDMLQMALKMATELDEPAVDLEGALTANTITAPPGGEPAADEATVEGSTPITSIMDRPAVRGRKRSGRQSRGQGAKRGRRMSHQVDIPLISQPAQPAAPQEPAEKPDANMCLKYTFGVNAWKQWVTTKNTELEKSTRRVKLFKTEILQLTADELNYSLCLFVKEVRKPNGAEYAPDTIYYLCLGIQQYLFENGRIDNIFCDPYYEKFTDCLDEVAKKFSVLYNDSHYIVTRVEEEHLWESKQLGAHSPHVLLSTLMFFNTKHFNLTSVDEHMQLSFSHIMKHWKRNPNQPGASKVPGSRNVLLRFYPPQSAIQNNVRKKKVYEQQENEENPLRCPVKLYEFYLSKCPESVKTRNDVFYLQPERSCVPDSPVWYSTMPLPREALEKMLHRVKMVKEINVALLTS